MIVNDTDSWPDSDNKGNSRRRKTNLKEDIIIVLRRIVKIQVFEGSLVLSHSIVRCRSKSKIETCRSQWKFSSDRQIQFLKISTYYYFVLKRILAEIAFLIFLFGFCQIGYAQNVSDWEYRELPEDPYMPIPIKDIRTNKSFQIQSDNFFCVQVNVDSLGRNIMGDAANEPTIAINPLNPNEIVMAWRQFDNVQSNFRQAGYAYSTDGGITWTNAGPLEKGNFRSDPVLDSDGQGRFYFNSLLIEDGTTITNQVFRSEGIGTWDEGTFAFGGDKQWMIVDKTSSQDIRIFNTWSPISPFSCSGDFTKSIDGGDSFRACEFVRPRSELRYATFAIGPDRELYIAGDSESRFRIAKSQTALTTTARVEWETNLGIPNMDGRQAFYNGPNPGGLLGQVEIDVDVSDGPNRGNVYVLATVNRDNSDDSADIMFTRSTDGGFSFRNPQRLNPDGNPEFFQWFGTMSIAPNGRLDVIWLDTKDNPGTFVSSLYYRFSVDGGLEWSTPVRLSPGFDPHIGWPRQQKIGDYYHMVSVDEGAHIAWAATFNNEQDVYYGFVSPDLTTSTNDLPQLDDNIQFEIYPNPTKGPFYLEINTRLKLELQIDLYNSEGQTIYSDNRQMHGTNILGSHELFGSNTPYQGVYFISIASKKYGSIIRRVILVNE